jgi:hypothetical protein
VSRSAQSLGVGLWLALPFRACAQHDRYAAQTRHSAAFSTAVGHRADLPRAGLDGLVVTQAGRCGWSA